MVEKYTPAKIASIVATVLAEKQASEVPDDAWDGTHDLLRERDRVSDNLWIGAYPSSGVKGFKYVFALAGRPYPSLPPETIVTYAPFDDDDKLPSEAFLHELADGVVQSVQKGPTLVHCMAGINRSGMITALALIKMGWEPAAAVSHLRAVRGSVILMNETFESWILQQ